MYFAPQASVKAVDIHGNSQRITKRDSGLYARLAEWVPKLPGTLRLVKQAFPVSLTPLEVVGLLAGFSFAVGQSVNDIITLLRNPDQLLAFVDLAKAVYDRPEILPTLVGAFVDTFQQFHNVQNPFPGPQNLLNPTNPESFTNDNSTFGRTWFGGYGLGFVALGVLSGGASAAGLTALEGISVTAANTIRFVVSAPSLLASRAAGIVGKSALRVAVRVGRATELRTSAVKRAVSGLPTPRLRSVSASIRRLDDDLEDAIAAGCGGGFTLAGGDCLDEELARLVRAHREGVTLLNRLPRQRAVQLLGDVDPNTQELLVRAWDNPDADVDLADVQAVITRYRSLGAADQRRFARVVPEATDGSAVRFVQSMDSADLRRFLGLAEEVPDGRLQRFVTQSGETGARMVRDLDDGTLRDVFEMEKFVVGNSEKLARYGSWTQWRSRMASLGSETDLDFGETEEYVEEVRDAIEDDNIGNPRSLIDEVRASDSPGDFRGTAGEVKRALHYAEQGAEVKVEPHVRIDLKVELPDGGVKLIEVKTRNGLLTRRKIKDYLLDAGNSAEKKFSDPDVIEDGDIDMSNSDTVLEIRANDGLDETLTSNGVENVIRDIVEDARSIGVSFSTDEVRVLNDGNTIGREVITQE